MTAASDLRNRTAEAWRALRDAVDDVDLDAPTAAGWTGKEMIAHVAFWLETTAPFVTGMWRGDPSAFTFRFPSGYVPPDDGTWPDANTHNAREAAWARERSGDEVLARLDAAWLATRDFLETVTDEEATEHADYFAGNPKHLDEHRLELLAPTGGAPS